MTIAHEYAILYFEINLLSLVLIGIILYKTNGLSKMVAQRNFVMSIIAEIVFFASDTLFVMVHEGVLPGNSTVMMICKEVYFLATVMMCFFWFLYFEYLRVTKFVLNRRSVALSSTIVWLMIILLIANLAGKFLFYVDESGTYHRGQLFILTYVLSYIYVFVAFFRVVSSMLKADDQQDKHLLVRLALFPIGPGLAGILQFIFPRIPAACVVLAITTLLLYLTWTDQLISVDPLTGLNNRKQLLHAYNNMTKSHGDSEGIWLYLIDANHFKRINDTYGHLQGDYALKYIAEALRTACKGMHRGVVIARYGGDEFIVLSSSDEADSTDDVKNRICIKLAEIVEREKIPFGLTVSIGVARARKNEQLKDLMARADKAMYEEKNAGR
jgi:diguanylate cyclase (GGDEF)-like protein